jgi:SAM-dependent methyltransferase
MIYARAIACMRRYLPPSLFEALLSLRRLAARRPIDGAEHFRRLVAGRYGLEIGGPSAVFVNELPLYGDVSRLDGVNFASRTLWQGDPGEAFDFMGGRKGSQYVSDGTHLSAIDDETYDFVLSSNCLEHIANPLRALAEWARVTRPGGALILIVPNKEGNFDHRRPVTRFEHLLDDLNNGTGEDDLTHLDEILALHDLSLDPAAGTFDEFSARSRSNSTNRALHHHVFDLDLAKRVVEFSGFVVVHATSTRKDYFVAGLKAKS